MSDILANHRATVALNLGNRADISTQGTSGAPSRVDLWLWQAYLNLGMSYNFEQAEDSISGQWTQGQDYIAYPANARAITSIQFYRTDGTALRINWKDIAYLRRYPTITGISSGPPSIVAPHGEKLYVRPLCDVNTYNFIADLWLKPQQIVGESNSDYNYTSLGTADIGATLFQVPDDWLEVIELSATLRGHVALLERDKANELQELLFGYTAQLNGRYVPGLIAQMWKRRQAQAPFMDYGIQPRQNKRGYTYTGA